MNRNHLLAITAAAAAFAATNPAFDRRPDPAPRAKPPASLEPQSRQHKRYLQRQARKAERRGRK